MENHKRYGESFYCRVFSKDWLFIASPQDVKYISTLPAKVADNAEPFSDIAGHLFSKTSIPPRNANIQSKSEYEQFLGILKKNTPGLEISHIAASVRPSILKAWLPELQRIMEQIVKQVILEQQRKQDDDDDFVVLELFNFHDKSLVPSQPLS